jgi:hypothetical protein
MVAGPYGPMAAYAAAMIGQQTGTAVGNFMMAGKAGIIEEGPLTRERLLGKDDWSHYGVSQRIGENTGRFARMAERVNKGGSWDIGIGRIGNLDSWDDIGWESMSKAWHGVSGAMIAGGTDPFRLVGNKLDSIDKKAMIEKILGTDAGVKEGEYKGLTYMQIDNRLRAKQKMNPGLINTLIYDHKIAVNNASAFKKYQEAMKRDSKPDIEYAEQVTMNAIAAYGGKVGPEVLKSLNPIFASEADTGGNLLDILQKSGPELTYKYGLVTERNEGMTERLYSQVGGSIRVQRRNQRLAGYTLGRGSGAKALSSIEDELGAMEKIEGYGESESYAEARSRRKQARGLKERQGDIVSYDLPMGDLEGMRSMMDAMPYSPANGLVMTGAAMTLRGKRIGELDTRYKEKMARGEMTEEEQLSARQEK